MEALDPNRCHQVRHIQPSLTSLLFSIIFLFSVFSYHFHESFAKEINLFQRVLQHLDCELKKERKKKLKFAAFADNTQRRDMLR